MSKTKFQQIAKPLPVSVNGIPMAATPMIFGKNKPDGERSVGWNVNGKVNVEIDGTIHRVQVSGNFTITGSKDWPMEDKAA
jgi:flagellar basal body L-ring protein FlgH